MTKLENLFYLIVDKYEMSHRPASIDGKIRAIKGPKIIDSIDRLDLLKAHQIYPKLKGVDIDFDRQTLIVIEVI